jgi:hypothetical protein
MLSPVDEARKLAYESRMHESSSRSDLAAPAASSTQGTMMPHFLHGKRKHILHYTLWTSLNSIM